MGDLFYGHEARLKGALRRLRHSNLSAANKKLLLQFHDHCFSEGLSAARVSKYLYLLGKLAHWLGKDFPDASRDDIKALVAEIERSNHADWTKRDLKIALKKFYRWLRQTEDYPPEVNWLRTYMRNNTRKLPDELLTPGDVEKLIAATQNSRDRAFVSLLYESGCRISEVALLKIKHLQPHSHGYRVTVHGKTGSRSLLIVASASYLTAWINEHPRKDDPNAWLWVTTDHRSKLPTYRRLADLLHLTAKRAGVTKKVNPHNFRHSRATHLANHLTEAQMNEFFGWVQGSEMPSIYVHLSGRDVDKALLRTYGIDVPENEKEESSFKPKPCPRCSRENPPTNKFCSTCGMVLDKKTADEMVKRDLLRRQADDVLDRLIQDEEFQKMLLRKLGAIKAKSRGGYLEGH